MLLATIRTPERGTQAVRVDPDGAVEVGAPDVGSALGSAEWRTRVADAAGDRHDLAGLEFAPLVPRPAKIFCVGLNYRSHIEEMGREVPTHPTLFAKFASALVGAGDEILLPAASERVDWEAELAVVVGARARHVDEAAAAEVIAGYTVVNDITARDFQRRTTQWLQGKTFESTTPLGPYLLTRDDPVADREGFELWCEVNGSRVQRADTSDLVFGPAALVSYISQIVTLEPGDVIATGTPGGVGDARTPAVYLADGDHLVTCIEGIGSCRNRCRREGGTT
jgi:acylpyruvate hydrolase